MHYYAGRLHDAGNQSRAYERENIQKVIFSVPSVCSVVQVLLATRYNLTAASASLYYQTKHNKKKLRALRVLRGLICGFPALARGFPFTATGFAAASTFFAEFSQFGMSAGKVSTPLLHQ
jgi:hypothetical protein